MNFIVLLCLIVVHAKEEMAITPEYIDYLKKVADWEVSEYEDNVFKGWTLSEVEMLLGDKKPDQEFEATPVTEKAYLPSSVDWAGNQCIHKILDQGNCGSCWAFAAAGVASDKCCLEDSQKDFGWLSPQELVSCDKGEGKNEGCNGGFARDAFEYIKKNGLVDMDCVPYKAKNLPCPKECKNGKDWKQSHHCRCQKIEDCSGVEKMKTCLVDGPVSARMKVYRDFLAYKSGVYCMTKGSQKLSDHAIRCVGFTDNGNEQIVHCANSWSTYWGDKGYFYIRHSADCGFYEGEKNVYTVRDCTKSS